MKKVVPLTFDFAYADSPTSKMCVKTAYGRIFATAKRNLIAKGLLKRETHIDVENSGKVLVDTSNAKAYAESDGRISDDSRISSKVESGAGNSCPDGAKEGDSSGESGNGLAHKQSVFDKFISTSQSKE
jgi:hypothetical protein